MKKKKKKINGKPPFYWPLILGLVIFVEFVVLYKEKTWSQTYGVSTLHLRDQVEKITSYNSAINLYLANLYSSVGFESQPLRELIVSETPSLTFDIRNENIQRY